MKELTDADRMPFGKHQGKKMQDVPAEYLFWLWTNGMEHNLKSDVADYIRRNLETLRKEHPDGIW